MDKKGFLPQVLGMEIHYGLVGFAIGAVLVIVLLLLAKFGIIPINLCSFVC